MRLIDMFNGEKIELACGAENWTQEITGLSADSRNVAPGYLFAALPGSHGDGRAFIADAIAGGARVILAPPGTDVETVRNDVCILHDDNPRRRFALLAARFYAPAPQTVVAVTGTNAKTSVVTMVRQLWTRLGIDAASLGTLGLVSPRLNAPGMLTTPDPVALYGALKSLAEDGVDHLAMEASSHGLAQYRLDGVRVRAGAFTNITRDHLDYHRTMAAYFDAKMRLFTDVVAADGAAVVNADMKEAGQVADICRSRGLQVFSYGREGRDFRLIACRAEDDGLHATFEALGCRRDVALPLVGTFQALNALCACALVVACGARLEDALDALPAIEAVPGRMQRAGTTPGGARVYVDYAHTPDSLETALKALRPHTRGRLDVVFGCGGDRDKGKRGPMGEIACALADRVVVTDDNPRFEDAAQIRQSVIAACPRADDIADRALAIETAIGRLEDGDVLLLAGKGHETVQIVGDRKIPFDDAAMARAAIEKFRAANILPRAGAAGGQR
ncbi:UDP-N-acetylmuramoyl-L-alanyl-D-glutamate--2,6-diaminopimelate ligase [Varunaivibrio sulfuroxidans]|uniref:UDP-N-acetylmuramoyl-L-alanyl-D-glutamate--2,6-diaminopimelate ligase n=1 Tax=Varunaivibrio sulfuroxidans TaxID=1773489 RepID=A0A4R3JC20_9PROT|nr:UDP-N-acetylmuramoyl-L-alanyl-D-glutamate--2,6-diaminopimelate ligase [Varunaivibrio sulfuroxidans]TCS62190.1 UDP-N-acetylmuramoylalanyl-D-glutamate--2,6-diaminopimelate ligase [Varunaivibrio sulfuroxidans]WES30617.1 UDP-N-acetylmuramoyl-L-alanyl-D-glutamate--2,6-diaminopimelate ligase [Varunaivibrio sulfuroxidans]